MASAEKGRGADSHLRQMESRGNVPTRLQLPGCERLPVRILLNQNARDRRIQLMLHSDDRTPGWFRYRRPRQSAKIHRLAVNRQSAESQVAVCVGGRAEG